MSKLPAIIKKVGFPFNWEEDEVWNLNVPTECMGIDELIWHFDIPFWETDGGDYSLKPRDVIHSPDKYPSHKKRIEGVDIAYPLDILKNPKTGYWTLLDGLHRLVKIFMTGAKTVSVRKISLEDMRGTPSYKEL